MRRRNILTFCSAVLVTTFVACVALADHPSARRAGYKAPKHARHCPWRQRPERIYVGPSASGDALRILDKGYALHGMSRRTHVDGPVLVGPEDLDAPWIVDRLMAAYEAGHAVALTNGTPDDIEHFRVLLDHQGESRPSDDDGAGAVHLAALRRVMLDDGRAHFRAHLLLPRVEADPESLLTPEDEAMLRRLGKKKGRGWQKKARQHLVARRLSERREVADRQDLEALRDRVFAAEPELSLLPTDSPEQNLTDLTQAYNTHTIQSDSHGNQVQIWNSVWAVRSFQNSADYYYVYQELDYRVAQYSGDMIALTETAKSYVVGQQEPTSLLRVSPDTTQETTTVTTSTDYTLGGSAGWNATQGFNALVSGSISVSHSTSVTVPPVIVTNDANFATGEASWQYAYTNPQNSPSSTTLKNQWIWSVPFSSYTSSQTELQFESDSGFLGMIVPYVVPFQLSTKLVSTVPMPFGQTFALQEPTITSITPACVDTGETFSILGSGFYPALVDAVIIGGEQVEAANLTLSSDTLIEVIAPDTIECHFTGCTVAVQTAQGTSNDDQTIAISSLCD